MASYQQLQKDISKDNISHKFEIICKNIKKYRLEKYNEFKLCNLSKLNPYSTENIAALLGYNHNHYKRYESDNDKLKRIPLEQLLKLCISLDKTLDDFLKED